MIVKRACRTLGALALLFAFLVGFPSESRGQKRIYATVDPNLDEESERIFFDVNSDPGDNFGPNIVFSEDGETGFVGYTGSGVVIAFSMETGEILARIQTDGKPFFGSRLVDGRTLAVTSVLDNRIFLIDMEGFSLAGTYSFAGAKFGFGSNLEVSSDGRLGYIASTGTGELIKFDMETGTEIDRLGGMISPVQVTLSPDGSTALVVDVSAEELVFAATSGMTKRKGLKNDDPLRLVNFTAQNRAILTPDGTRGILASKDLNGILGSDTVFYFDTATGEILDSLQLGSEPGFTGMTPDGKYWMILNEFSLSVIPTDEFRGVRLLSVVRGDPLPTSNLAFSPDGRFVYYSTAAEDLVFQQDIETGAAVGRIQVGDDPDVYLDQPAFLAAAPDGKRVAVLNFLANTIDLLTDVTVLNAAKFVSSAQEFSGLSLVNLSGKPATVTVIAIRDTGQLLVEEELVNPIELVLQPNHQISKTVAQLFGFDDEEEREGWLSIYADVAGVVGYLSVGDTSLTKLDGVPLMQSRMNKWVVPEILRQEGKSVELNIINPNFSTARYDVVHFGPDGEQVDYRVENASFAASRQAQDFTEIFPIVEEGTKGHLSMVTNEGLQFVEFVDLGGAIGGISAIDSNNYAGVTRLYSPQFAVNADFKTVLNLINTNDEDAEVRITLHGPDGAAIAQPFEATVASNGQLRGDLVDIFQDDPALANSTGWIEINTTKDRVVGTVTFTNESEGFLGIFELSGTPLGEFMFPVVAQDDTYYTGMALLNPNQEPADVTVEVWGGEGTLDRSATLLLPPATRQALYLSQIFPEMGHQLTGHMRIRSDKPLHSFSLINDGALGFILTLPPIPMP